MISITRARASEFCEVLDFLDFVFSKNSRPHDFVTMYPNLYLPTEESMSNQICLRENGVLKACLLSYPRVMNVNGQRLKVNGIGNVACHPRERGRGFMTTIMKYNNEQMRLDKVHASDLGGRRLRYNRFGYDDAGVSYEADIPQSAVEVLHPNAGDKRYEFRPLKREDSELIASLKRIYEQKTVHFEYDTDGFYLRLIIPFTDADACAVFDGGELLGYIAVSGGSTADIREICLKDDKDICDVLFHYCVEQGRDLHVSFGEWQLKYTRPLFELAHGISVDGSHMWQIIDWEAVLSALMSLKASYTPVPEGALVLDIEGSGRLCVENRGGAFSVEPTDSRADITLGSLMAIGALTGRSPEIYTSAMGLDKKTAELFNCWFPAPLKVFDTERV